MKYVLSAYLTLSCYFYQSFFACFSSPFLPGPVFFPYYPEPCDVYKPYESNWEKNDRYGNYYGDNRFYWHRCFPPFQLFGLTFVLYLFGNLKGVRRDTSYYGGEELPLESRITGTDFYKSIQDMSVIKFMYAKAEAKWFDIYDAGRSILFGAGAFLQKFHNGILHLYVSWCLLGIIFVLMYMVFAK